MARGQQRSPTIPLKEEPRVRPLFLSHRYLFFTFSLFVRFTYASLLAASGVETVLPIKNSFTIPQATSPYTAIAKSVVHSNKLPSTWLTRKTVENTAVNGYVRV